MGKLLVVMLIGMFLAFESLEALDYGDALNKSILFFEGQRSGKLPTNQRVKWRADSGLSDGASANVNLIGGYYDAGDNVKFVWPMSFTTTLLSWAALEYQNEITFVNQLGYLRSTIKWGTNFILRAHTSTNMLYTQVGDGNSDHSCWERPEDMDTPRTLYSISSSSPGSEAAGEAAAALAAASLVFKLVDSTYSSKLLNNAKSLFEFADKYRGSYQASCPFYCSHSGYQDELLWAAAWLYKATGEKSYLNYVISNKDWSKAINEFSWDNKFAGVQALLASEFYNGANDLEKFKTDVESFVCALMPGSSSQQIKPTPGGILFIRDSSNLQYVTTATTILFYYSKTLTKAGVGSIQCGSTQFTVSQIRNFAKSQVDYILGNNPLKMSYMVGFGTKYPTQPHHRGSSLPSIQSKPEKIDCNGGFSYYNFDTPNPNVHTGAIVGGPNSSDQYSDKRTDYSHAEPTTYINAAFIGSVAALISSS
ncbi:glycosyl hydrolase 9B14 [Arabidopsis thaliana]|uniref:Endoglucanase 18 n=1 Tax=Arabidopsis thaliana TaxID=3702 RepID=GUN18_ARATH|nr:glycosyl hydrolase 9B14 [Arabidopsis thaliana]Q9SZ90.2 RecName: Full=Endoglucanase 18; AltName: Full=Endo-1,4-beta glucanase 18; Flags: Precursor [Arabidopsis thaliana]AEE82789.1 glycosyl hydrolase 9B14 [Arabidopsis thaliana]|eukprot:NP_849349.1 glycosyl hydrolase 9B14 [Arabidopsis thaliana]